MKKLFAVLAAIAVISIPVSALHIGIGKQRQLLQKGDIRVAKGEIFKGDIATDGSVVVEGTVTGDVAVFGGAVDVKGEVQGDVAVFGGGAAVAGRVKGDLASFGGPVDIQGTVDGEVASAGGDLTLGPSATVSGDVALMGGKLVKSDHATVGGSVTSFDARLLTRLAPVLRRWGRSAPASVAALADEEPAPARKAAGFAGSLIFAACVAFLLALLSIVLPVPVARVAEAAKADFWGAAGAGVLMMICFFPGLLLLVVSILGIPLIPLALIACAAAVFMGLAGVSRIAAERLFEAMQKPVPGAAVSTATGYALLVALLLLGKLMRMTGGIGALAGGTLSFAGFMVICAALVVGLGAVWKTRLGSRAV